MGVKAIREKAKLLFKRLSKDLGKDKEISLNKVNDYVQDVEKIKEGLYDNDCNWIDNFEEIEELSEGWFSEVTDEEIDNTLKECYEQLERMLGKLGVDLDEVIHPKTSQPSTVIHVSPTMTQSQSQETTVSIDFRVQKLIKEFEEELKKPEPDKSKLRKIIETVVKEGKKYAWKLLLLILKHWDKFNPEGFF